MADSIFRSDNSVTTILGAVNQFSAFAELSYLTDVRTTLNAKYGRFPNQGPPTIPVVRYFGIGINGFRNTDSQQGSASHHPNSKDMDLYQPIPFRVVPVDSDLTLSERSRYRMRTRELYNGVEYYCYYLKTILFDPNQVELVQIDASGNETPYPLDPNNLHPIPAALEVGGSVDTNVDRVIVRATASCEVTGAEVLEAVNIIYNGDLSKARISEFGFYTGCDVSLDANDNLNLGGTGGVKEAVYVQLSKKKCTTGTDMSDPSSSMTPLVTFNASDTCLL